MNALALKVNLKEPFNNCWIFYRFDKICEKVDKNKRNNQIFKFYFSLSVNLIFLIDFLLLYFLNDQVSVKNFLLRFDIGIYLGAKPQLVYLLAIFAGILNILLQILLNYSKSSDYKWFQIIDVFNECKDFHKIGLNDRNLIDKYVRKIVKYKMILNISTWITCSAVNLIIIFTVSFNFDLVNSLDWIVTVIVLFPVGNMLILNYHYSFFYFYIVCFNCCLRMSHLNQTIKKLFGNRSILIETALHQICIDLCKIISDINSYNKFWNRYIFIIYYCLTPFNLILLNTVISKHMDITLRSLCLLILCSTITVGLVFNWFTSGLNLEFIKFHKNLFNSYVNNYKNLELKLKLNLLNALEMCGERRRLIGFSCGQQFVITRQISFTTLIMFLRFFMLSSKFISFLK